MDNEEAPRPPPRPINDQVLVKGDPCIDKVGGLYLPQGEEKWPNTGTVLAVGPGTWEVRDGQAVRVPLEVRPGDRVLFKRQPASALSPDLREGDPNGWAGLVMLDYENVLGIIEPEGV